MYSLKIMKSHIIQVREFLQALVLTMQEAIILNCFKRIINLLHMNINSILLLKIILPTKQILEDELQ